MKRRWPWVVGIVVLLLVAVGVVCGIFASKIYAEAKEVKAHEERAMSMIGNLSDIADGNALDSLQANIPQIQQQTQAAADIVQQSHWGFASSLPWIGQDITTVRGMAVQVNNIMQQDLPQFVDAFNELTQSDLSAGDDQINLQPIIDVQPKLTAANTGLQHHVQAFDALPEGNISMVSDAYQHSKQKLDGMATKVDQISNTVKVIPEFLGHGDGPQTYAVMAATTSEMRSSGGLIGSVGELTTDNGHIAIGDFHSNADYLNGNGGSATGTADEQRIFQKEGPLRMSFDIRDLAVFPDTERVAQGMQEVWDRTAWGMQKPLDGVILVDPVFVQELVRINGPVTLPTGQVLNGDNTAEYLLNTIYKDYPNEGDAMDSVFGLVATQSIGDMFHNLNVKKLLQIGDIMGAMAQQRHFSMYAFNKDTEQTIAQAGFTASTPQDATKPQVGIYLTEQNPSKMGWYLQRNATITKQDCNKSGAQTYHVQYTMHNTITTQEAKDLPWYITGVNPNDRGNCREKTLLYAPKDGSISNLTVTGLAEKATFKQDTMNGSPIYRSTMVIKPGETATISFDVTTSDQATSDLTIDQTPMGWPGDATELAVLGCKK
ncbi:DUF4012 domain-containing protein [Bifidobacterium gallicum]|uniref:Chemotaxis protein n=1 Tax=Bifidobacterium gallicum DSM 20093 = LMG 11596 TaxID=561180 RepID=D1NVT6_9BIFI|nr:DUF4012 domain-containing protein [Bifidobacterium gallicum]EFA22937.1 hypothetical protein BIFGAL_03979 [Bifidobacterium gallicum DSM 20093 = LMG 11596]KFI59369.1 chemotaxis protein [Bifidobacterium gallicum DSM 20093 = LMG 11596]